MQVATQATPALLNKNFKKTNVVYYPEGDIHIFRDEKGIEVLDKDYRPYKPEREFVNIHF